MREKKDSGIEWIGAIPINWSICRIGNIFSLRDERNYKRMDEVTLLSLYAGIGVFPRGEYEERGNKAVTVEGYKIVRKNDIVVNIILSWMGALGISYYNGVTSPAYDVYIPNIKKVIPRFFHYVFRTTQIANECYRYGKGIMLMRLRTYSSEFRRIKVPLPSLNEQQKIADFLDHKCSEIDALSTDIQTQIETLEEYKKSVITEAVTKGLDPNVEMKDSGVEWLGYVPSAWKNKTLRHLLIDKVGGAWGNEPANENEGTVCLRIADFAFDKGLFKECALDELTYRSYTRKQIKKLALREGDILIEKSGGGEKTPVGRAVYYDGSYGAVLYANFMERLRFKSDEINSKFVEYWLRTWYFCRCSPFYINQTIGIQNIDLTLMLAKEQIFFPLLQDQYKIADFLDQKCSEIDQTISEKQQQLETLAEYKKSLIYEYVTGKREVA